MGFDFDRARARFPIFDEFQGGVYSDEVGALKPDAAIFQAATREFSLVPSEKLFVDDLSENVQAAASLGFKAMQYDARDHWKFLRATNQCGFHRLMDSIGGEEPDASIRKLMNHLSPSHHALDPY